MAPRQRVRNRIIIPRVGGHGWQVIRRNIRLYIINSVNKKKLLFMYKNSLTSQSLYIKKKSDENRVPPMRPPRCRRHRRRRDKLAETFRARNTDGPDVKINPLATCSVP